MLFFYILGYLGGPEGLSSHLYQSTYKIWKQSVQDFLSYRVHKDMSADMDAADAAAKP